MTERRAGWEEIYEGFEAEPELQVAMVQRPAPVIGVFDSGFGGLTVLKALLTRMPDARYVFLGDTARLPYGSKSQRTIARYASESAQFLVNEQGAEFLVIACNTASALALDAIRAAVSVPVLGVIEPGAAAAAASSRSKDVAVIATEATVASHAYLSACQAQGLRAVERACPLLVPLVEEGWIDSPVTAEIVGIYLDEVLKQAVAAGVRPDALVLGCTHYPLLRSVFEKALPDGMQIIDSAEATAEEAARLLGYKTTGVLEPILPISKTDPASSKTSLASSRTSPASSKTNPPTSITRPESQSFTEPQIRCFATDSVEKFERLGSRFLGRPVGKVELVDLGG
jgi:glutamate racemase